MAYATPEEQARARVRQLGEELRDAHTKLGDTRRALARGFIREDSLRAQLIATREQLSNLMALFTDDKIGADWRRTPYINVNDLREYERCLARAIVAESTEYDRHLAI
jgi:hypothetical protein